MREHPKWQERREIYKKISLLKERAASLEREIYAEEAEARKRLVPKYSYSTSTRRLTDGTECLIIQRRLSNREVYDRHYHYYRSCTQFPSLMDESPIYFRNGRALCQTGGGCFVLKLFAEVSDREWERLKKGDIPKRLLNEQTKDPFIEEIEDGKRRT